MLFLFVAGLACLIFPSAILSSTSGSASSLGEFSDDGCLKGIVRFLGLFLIGGGFFVAYLHNATR